jgi:hypothetical protein
VADNEILLSRTQFIKIGDNINYYIEQIIFEFHVRWGPCPHGMARPWVADGGTASRYGG